MKKITIILILFISVVKAFGQQKIGNNPTSLNSNAVLELESTNKGLLIPRIALTTTSSASPLSAHVAGMLVYNTATAGDVTPGFYVSTGSSWSKIDNQSSTTIYNGDGTLAGNRTVTQGSNTLTFTSSATNGFSVDGSTFSVDAANNRVGIGTTTPTSSLDVTGGKIRMDFGQTLTAISTDNFTHDSKSMSSYGLGWFSDTWEAGGPTAWMSGYGGIKFFSNGALRMALTRGGNLGIGNSTPSERLDVTGNIRFSGALMPNNLAGTAGQVLTSAGSGAVPTWTTLSAASTLYTADGSIPASTTRAVSFGSASNLNFDSNTLYIDGDNSRIGIGTNSPTMVLNVKSTTADALKVENSGAATTTAGVSNIAMINNNSTVGNYTSITSRTSANGYASAIEFINVSHTAPTGDIRFVLNNAGSYGERLRITAAGNLGIGKADPSEKLDVAGNVRFSGALLPNNSAGTSGQVLTSAGAGAVPTWTTLPTATTYTGSTSVTLNGTSFERAALTGDVTATANGNATTIATDAVTSAKILNGTIAEADVANDAISYAKLQNITTNNRLLGRGTTGAGDAEEITVGSGLTLTGTTLTASGGSTLYSADGTLSGNRTVTLGANSLSFSGSGTFRINGSSTAQSFSMGGAGIFGIDAPGIVNGRFSILENGNVGIGVASPTQKLDVNGGILARGNNAVSNQGAHLQWNRSASEGETWLLNQKGAGGSNAGIRFGSVTTSNATTEWARFVDNGSFSVDGSTFSVDAANNRVGIGTSSPQRNFDILGTNARMAIIAGENESATIGLGTNNSNSITGAVKTAIIAEGINSWSRAKLHFALSDNASSNSSSESATVSHARMTIQSDGNVGIGTVSPTSKLNVSGGKITIDASQTLTVNPTDNFSYDSKSMSHYGLGWFNDTWNTGGSTAWLSSYAGIKMFTQGSLAISVSQNGSCSNIYGSWSAFSDARIKTVKSEFKDGLDVIKQINPVRFVYNENAPFKSKDVQIGIVAQDLEKVAPYMVTKSNNGEIQDLREVNTQAYVFLLINAVKEQQAQIEEMKKEIEELKKDKK